MTGHKVFLSYSSEPEGIDNMRSAFTDVFKKFGPAVSGVRINVTSELQARPDDRALLMVDLCMSTPTKSPRCFRREPNTLFIWLDGTPSYGRLDPSVVWKHDAQTSRVLIPTSLGEEFDCASFEPFGQSVADDKVALRFLFQARNTLVANDAAQVLCSQLARADVAAGRPDEAAERIYLWLMHSADGAFRRDLRLRDLKMLNGWCDFEVRASERPGSDLPFLQFGGVKQKSSPRTDELLTAFVGVLRKAASRVLPAARARPDVPGEASDMAADYVSAAQVVALYYGKARLADKG